MSKTKFTCFREKPKHRVRTVIISSLIIVAMVCAVVFGIGFFRSPDIAPLDDLGYETVKYEVPDGKTPEESTALETVGYMNYILSNQSNWYSEMHGQVNTIISQEIATYKQFSNGVLISADITTSSMIANAFQFCTTDESVLWRAAAGGKDTFNGLETLWSEDAPMGLSISDYKTARGLPPSAFSVYIINEHTLLEEGTTGPVRNEDGTYTVSLNLNTTSDGEEAAVYYYKQQMAVTGGLSTLPTFNSINVKYTFDSNFRILKTEINESYQATMGVSVTCNAVSTTEYNYESGWENTEFEDYFSNYTNSFTQGGETGSSITAVGCLSSAFGSVLVDGATFAVDLGINGTTQSGIVDVGLGSDGLSSLSAQIGNIGLQLVKEDKNYIYLAYGDDLKLSICLDDIDLGGFSGGISLDTEDLLSQLGNGTFVVNEEKTVASLDCELSLMGLEIPLSFRFNLGENGEVTLDYVSTALTISGEKLEAKLAFTDKANAPLPLTEEEKATYKVLDATKLKAVITPISSDAMEIAVNLALPNLAINGSITLDLGDLFISADLSLTMGGTTKDISIAYRNDIVYLKLGENSKIKTSLKNAIDLITQFLGGTSTTTPAEDVATPVRVLIGETVNALKASDGDTSSSGGFSLMNIVYTLLFDKTFTSNIKISDEGELKFNLDEILVAVNIDLESILGTPVKLGELTVGINEEGKLNFSSPVIQMTIFEGSKIEIVEEEYVNLDLVDLSEYISNILSAGQVALEGEIEISIGTDENGINVPLTINQLSLNWNDGISLYLSAVITLNEQDHRLIVSYSETGAAVVYDSLGIQLTAEEYKGLAEVISSMIATVDGVDIDIDLSSLENILNTITSSTSGSGSGISVGTILNLLEGLNITNNTDENSDTTDSYTITIDGIGTIDLVVVNDSEHPENNGVSIGLDIGISGIGVKANINLIDYTEGTLPTDLEYLSGETALNVLNTVSDILENKKVTLSGSATVALDENTTVGVVINGLELDWSNGIAVELSATISLNGVDHSLYVSYNADGAKVAYDTLGLSLTNEQLNELIAKIKTLINIELPTVSTSSIDVDSIFNIINNLRLTSSENGLVIGYDVYEVSLTLNPEISASTALTISGIGVNANLTLGTSTIVVPEVEYLSGTAILNVVDDVLDILNDKKVTLSGSASVVIDENTTVGLVINGLEIDWSNGIAVELSATVSLNGVEHSLYVSYNAEGAKVAYDTLGLSLTADQLNELIAKVKTLVNIEMPSVSTSSIDVDSIFNIINNLRLTSSENGLVIGYDEYEVALTLNPEISASTALTISGIGVNANLTLGTSTIVVPEVEYLSGTAILNVVDDVLDILSDKKVTLSGSATVALDENTTVGVVINGLELDWSNGIAVELSATISLNGVDHSLYVSYNADGAKVAYDTLGLSLTADQLNELIAKVKTLVNIEMPSVSTSSIDVDSIFNIINNLRLTSSENGLVIGYDEYEVSLTLNPEISASTALTISGIGVNANLTLGTSVITVPEVEYLSGTAILNVVDDVLDILNDKKVTLSGSASVALDENTTVGVVINGLELDWNNGIAVELSATVSLNGVEHSLYVSYTADGAKVAYDTLGLSLTADQLNELIAKIKTLVNIELPTVSTSSIDVDSIFNIINNLRLTSSENGLVIGYDAYEVSLTLNPEISASTALTISGIGVNANLTLGTSTIVVPEVEYLSGTAILNVVDDVLDILNDKKVTLSGSAAVALDENTTVGLVINGLELDWNNGIAVELSATISLNGVDHSLYVSYNSDGAKVAYDTLGLSLTADQLNELIAKIKTLVNIELPTVSTSSIDVDSIFNIINNLKLTSSENGLVIGYDAYEVALTLNPEISASTALTISGIGVNANLTLGTSTIVVPEVEYLSGTAILNVVDDVLDILNDKKVTLSGNATVALDENTTVGVVINGLEIDWSNGIAVELSATVSLNGVEHSLYVSYNADGAKVAYDTLGLSLTADQLNELIAKIKTIVNIELPTVSTSSIDVDSIFNIINNLKLTSSENGLVIGYDVYEVSLTLNPEISASTALTISGIGVNANLTLGTSTIVVPEVEYLSGTAILNVVDDVLDILNDKKVTLSGSASIALDENTTVGLVINGLELDWNNGIAVELSATISLNGVDHSLYVSYNADGAKVAYDTLGLSLTTDQLNELIAKVKTLVNIELPSVSTSSIDVDSIFNIINNLKLTSSENGLVIGYDAYEVALILNPEISASTALTISGIGVNANLTLGTSTIVVPEVEYLDGAILNVLLDEISEIINSGKVRIAITGESTLQIIAGDTVVKLSDIIFELSFKGGIGFEMNASLEIGGNKHDLYASYLGDTLKFSYATFGAELKISGEDNDIDKLKVAVVELYNRVAKIIDTMTGTSTTTQVTSFDDLLGLLETLGASDVLTDVLGSLTSMLPSTSGEVDIVSTVIGILNKATIVSSTNGISVALDGLNIGFNYNVTSTANFDISLSYETNDFKIVADRVEIGKVTDTNGAYERIEDYLTVADFIEMLDYVGATVDMFAESSFSLGVVGTVYSTESKYSEYNYIRYIIDAKLEYEWGDNGYPAHLEVPEVNGGTNWNFYLDSTMYAHIGVYVYANHADDSSYKIDLYIVDANPGVSSGITNSSTSTDGELDVYVSVSVLSNGVAEEPLMVYMPASDLMTIIAAGAAMLDVGSLGLDTEGMDGVGLEAVGLINSVIQTLAGGIDSLIVDKYLTDTREQFESLGSSLITQILGDSLNGMLNGLVGSLLSSDEDSSSEIVLTNALPQNEVASGFIKEVSFNESKDALILLNSQYIYGNLGFDDIKFTATKITKENADGTTHTLLKTANLENIYYNSNNKYSVDIGIQMSYDDIKRKDSFAGYYNFSEIDSLLTTLVNSATHTVTKEDGTSGYDLNRNFYLSGSIDLSVLGVYNASVDINAISITLDENNNISGNVRLSYDKVELFFGAVSVINNKAVVDISIKDDMIYMKRAVSGGATTYRTMTLAAFGGDIMDQMIYILSLGKTVTSNMEGSSSGGSSAATDIGATVKQLLKSFTSSTSGNSKSWTITINGDGVGSLAGGLSITDIPLTISADKVGDGYVAKKLSASGKLYSVISFSLGLDYHNPQSYEVNESNKYVNDITTDVYAESIATVNGEAVSLADVLGGTSSKAISSTINWKNLLSDQDNVYFEYTSGGSIKIGSLTYENQTDMVGGINKFAGTYLALYNSNGTLYTIPQYPELTTDIMPDIDGQTKVWADPIISDGNVVVRAVYATTYTVTVNSSHQTSYTAEQIGDTFTTDYYNVYKYQLLPINLLVDEYDGMYILTGYTYADGTAVKYDSTINDRNGNLCIIMNVESDLVVNAVWSRAYAVILHDYNGLKEVYFAEGTTVTVKMLPEPFERDGYTGSWVFESQTLTGNIEVSPVYEVSIHTVTITSDVALDGFSSNGDKFVWSESYTYGTTITLPDYEDLDLYTYGGYYLSSGGKIENEQYIVSDLDITLRWVARSIVVNVNSAIAYSLGGRSYVDGNSAITINDGVYDLGTPTAEGYTFLGWWQSNGSSYSAFTETNLKNYVINKTESISLYALWATSSNTISMSRSGFFQFTYKASGNFTWLFYADNALLNSVTVSSATYSMRVYSGSVSENWTSGSFSLSTSISGNVMTMKSTNGYSNKKAVLFYNGEITANMTISVSGTAASTIQTTVSKGF